MLSELLHRVASMEAKDTESSQYYPRPSLAGPERCLRQLVYQATETTPDSLIPGRIYHVFDDGNWHEELTANWIGKTAYVLHSQQMTVELLDVTPRLYGHIDGIVTDPVGKDYLWEHKSINHFGFIRYAQAKAFPEDYFTQCAIYLKGLYPINPDLTEGLLLLKNKNTAAFLEYHLAYDYDADRLTVISLSTSDGDFTSLTQEYPLIVQNALARFRQVNHHAKDGTFPDRPYDYSDWHCQYCSFQKTCWDGATRDLKALTDTVDLEPELADTLRYYNQLGAEIKEQEQEKKKIGSTLLALLKERKVKEGRAGEYKVSLVAYEKADTDWAAVPLSVKSELEKYPKLIPVSFVRVSQLKREATV